MPPTSSVNPYRHYFLCGYLNLETNTWYKLFISGLNIYSQLDTTLLHSLCSYPSTLFTYHTTIACHWWSLLWHLCMANTYPSLHEVLEGTLIHRILWIMYWYDVPTFYILLYQISDSRILFILIYFYDISTLAKYHASKVFYTSSWSIINIAHALQSSIRFLLCHDHYPHAWKSLYFL